MKTSKFAEDLELASRIKGRYAKRYVPDMVMYHHSRETFTQYAKQMYRYGFMKLWFSFASRSFRWLDFVPIALLVGGMAPAWRCGHGGHCCSTSHSRSPKLFSLSSISAAQRGSPR